MERIVHKAKNHKEAELWDIYQQVNMKPEERQRAAKKLKEKVFGIKSQDIKEAYKRKK